MKQIRLLSLKLLNFKGIKDLEIVLNGYNGSIFGENATGKTSIADAFMWLLFDKDSSNRKDFEIKTLTANNEVIHGLDHSVKAVLLIDSRQVILQKIYKEKWVKKRGEAERQLTGHTTDYYIDEVPVKKSEYDHYIKEVMDESIFKLVTNVLFFNEQLNWKDRRKTLLEICGDVSDELVIDSNAKLKRLVELLENTTVEELRAKVKARRKLLNDDIKTIPIRIDEIVKGMPEAIDETELNKLLSKKAAHESSIESIDDNIKAIDNKILGFSNVQDAWDNKNKLLANKKHQLAELKFIAEKEANNRVSRLRMQINKANDEIAIYKDRIKSYSERVNKNLELMDEYNQQVIKLRAEWSNIEVESIKINSDFTCPTCGQELPEDMRIAESAKLKANAEAHKKTRLEIISSKGKQLVSKIEEIKSKNEEYKSMIDAYQGNINEYDSKVNQLDVELKAAIKDSENIDFNDSAEYQKLVVLIESLEADIANPDDASTDEKDELIRTKEAFNERKKAITEQINMINQTLSSADQIKKSNKRIEELKEQERWLANEIADLEGKEFLTEEFIKTKVDLLESRINNKFKTVSFKMFNVLVNGALEETCDTLINGVPFSSANNAAKINAGIDIINTLSEHYDIQAPIFIDNRESVNDLIDSDSQIVSLIVSKDKELKVKTVDIVSKGAA